MADYLTQTILENALSARTVIQCTDDLKTGSVNTTVLAQVIADTESDVNPRINKGFILPITVVDHGQRAFDAVMSFCIRVAKYHLYLRRNLVNEALANDYSEALKSAEKMGRGNLALPGDPPVPRSSPEALRVTSGSISTRTATTRPANRRWTKESQG